MTDVAAGAQTRSKTITWQDPLPTARLGATMSGLEYLTAVAEGRVPGPPIAAHFGLRWERIGHGEVVAVAEPDESLYNPIGMVHGGSRRRCWTRWSAARCTRRCRPASATRRWS